MGISAQGMGRYSGMNYCVSGHTEGNVTANLGILAITSADINNMNRMVKEMLSASERNKVDETEGKHVSGNISFWSFLGAGAKAGYDDTKKSMHSKGLTDKQIDQIIEKLFEMASHMQEVGLDLTVHNDDNDYEVCGEIDLWTLEGSITYNKKKRQIRMLSNQGFAGQAPVTSPSADGGTVPAFNYSAKKILHKDARIDHRA